MTKIPSFLSYEKNFILNYLIIIILETNKQQIGIKEEDLINCLSFFSYILVFFYNKLFAFFLLIVFSSIKYNNYVNSSKIETKITLQFA
jgi:hypothetical protein